MARDEDTYGIGVDPASTWECDLSMTEQIEALSILFRQSRQRWATDDPVQVTAYTDERGKTLALLATPPACAAPAKLFALPEFVRLTLERVSPEAEDIPLMLVLESLFGIEIVEVDTLPDFTADATRATAAAAAIREIEEGDDDD